MKTNAIEIKKALKEAIFDSVGQKKNGNIVVREGYFYTHGRTSEKLAESIKKILNHKEISFACVYHGNHWATFRGGASLASSSHFWVEVVPITLTEDGKDILKEAVLQRMA